MNKLVKLFFIIVFMVMILPSLIAEETEYLQFYNFSVDVLRINQNDMHWGYLLGLFIDFNAGPILLHAGIGSTLPGILYTLIGDFSIGFILSSKYDTAVPYNEFFEDLCAPGISIQSVAPSGTPPESDKIDFGKNCPAAWIHVMEMGTNYGTVIAPEIFSAIENPFRILFYCGYRYTTVYRAQAPVQEFDVYLRALFCITNLEQNGSSSPDGIIRYPFGGLIGLTYDNFLIEIGFYDTKLLLNFSLRITITFM